MNKLNISYEQQLMISQITALSHLRPNYSLPLIGTKESAKLLAELIEISGTQNLFAWLQNERGFFCAVLTLSLCLKVANHIRLSRQKLSHTQHQWAAVETPTLSELEEKQNILFGHLLEGTEEWPFYEPWSDALSDSYIQEQMRQTLRMVQEQANLISNPHPVFSQDNMREVFVLCDLLRLPKMIDPISWLQEERKDIIAYLTLSSLLEHILPPKRMILASSPTKSQQLHKPVLNIGDNFTINIQQFTNHELGFIIDISTHYTIPKELQSMSPDTHRDVPQRMINWKGFEYISDTNGYSYISQVIMHRAHTGGNKRRQENLTLVCWPPLETSSQVELILRTQPVILASYEVPIFLIEGRSVKTDTIVPRPGFIIAPQLQTHLTMHF
jgi:hypothetical protein